MFHIANAPSSTNARVRLAEEFAGKRFAERLGGQIRHMFIARALTTRVSSGDQHGTNLSQQQIP